MIQLASTIYDRLQDDISREIYINRFAYNITKDYKYIRKIFDCLDITSVLLETLKSKKEMVVFGAGRYGDILVKAFPEFPWVAYIDNDEEKWGTTLHGLPIVSANDLRSNYKNAFVVISLLDVPVTFIKMDIEGSELNALHGGEALISKYHPKLAICIYHKPEDVIEIPKFIIECYSGYKFYIRYYALTENETVLYAVP